MNTFKEQAAKFVGKRIIIGLREVRKDEEDIHSGLWGIIEKVHNDGMLLRVEGGIDEKYWMIPPDLDAIEVAEDSEFQFGEGGPIVTGIELEAYFVFSNSSNLL